jgi:hypothetical protein
MAAKGLSAGVDEKKLDNGKNTPRRGRLFIILAAALVAAVVLALALGLGLGLGLKHSKSKSVSSPSPTANSDTGSSLSSQQVQDWRRSTLDYSLDLEGWDFGASPTTRSYNFSLTEISASPDGK